MIETYSGITYSQLQAGRQECARVFGSFQKLPIIASAYQRIQEIYYEIGGKVLDVGAGVNKPLKSALGLAAADYMTLDDDPDGDFTFRSVQEIPSDCFFNLIVANQFFEHLTIEQTVEVMQNLVLHLSLSSYIVVTVPNIAHPNRFWAVTHVTPWDYMSIYSLYRLFGLSCLEIARYNKTAGPQNLIEHWLVRIMARLYRIDWCDSIMVVGQKSKLCKQK